MKTAEVMQWAWKVVDADLTARNGYQYKLGKWHEASGILEHDDPCPHHQGDGLCIATDFYGAAQGGRTARTILLTGYYEVDVLGRDEHKLRVRKLFVFPQIISLERLLRETQNLYGANLHGANLSGANLSHGDLRHADLRGANLYSANLCDGDLRDADLRGGDLRGADVSHANLRDEQKKSAIL